MTDTLAPRSEPLWLRFHDLMPYRVREVLLVSSPYDFFILEEDGRLTERIFTAYSELNLSSAPRIIHAPMGAAALELVASRRFDLVMTMVRLEDMDVDAFGRSVKELDPQLPVVLLALTEADLLQFPSAASSSAVDLIFLWTGDSHILLAIIKQVEDRLNAEHDTRAGDVRVIMVVEDSVRRYSHLLSVIYSELMAQSQSLITEGMNDLQRLIRMRARPKLLLARTYEEAIQLYTKYRDNTLAVVADIRFPRGGVEDPEAGIDLVRTIRADDAEIPVLLQSAERGDARLAQELHAMYMDKNDKVLRQIRKFVSLNLGFGDFVFRMPDGREVARARSTYEMEEVLRTLPAESLEFHASHNHISLWLIARCMFRVAGEVEPWTIEKLGGVEANREKLVSTLRRARLVEQEGVIADLGASKQDVLPQLVRLGTGSIGGKGRGIAFIHFLLAREGTSERFEELEMGVPGTVVMGTDLFDRFIEENGLGDVVEQAVPDEEIVSRFLQARFPDELMRELGTVHESLSGPLAVRSSSLLEDAHSQPFAGVYATYMLPNNHGDAETRFCELVRAIKGVYASTYCRDARSYVASTPYSLEEEKMGVVIQQLVGRRHGDRFYPTISGVARSYNYYPIGEQRADEGICLVALGLGQTVMQDGTALQFSPGTPTFLPQFSAAREFLPLSQSSFVALDMTKSQIDFVEGVDSTLGRYGLEAAEADGSLWSIGSVYVSGEGRIRDTLDIAGQRVVTFNNILKGRAIPLADAIAELLRIFKRGLGCAIEIEFAVELGDLGRDMPHGHQAVPPRLYVLQVRPEGSRLPKGRIQNDVEFQLHDVLCQTDRSLGHGVIEDIRDIVWVKSQKLKHYDTPSVASQVGELNATLTAEKRPYLLIGPGRWGTTNPALGIPVVWSQIAGARVIVETTLHGRDVEPSQGTHFFHNIVSFEIGYLSLSGARHDGSRDPILDLDWLRQQSVARETPDVRQLRLADPLRVYLDGREGRATILKPRASTA